MANTSFHISQKTLVSLSTALIVGGLIFGYVIRNENRITKMETRIETQNEIIKLLKEKCN
jgi:hypothetical protein